MNWPLALGVAVIIAAPAFAVIRAFRTAPIGEEVDGLGFVADPQPNSGLSRQQYSREGQPNVAGRFSVGGQVNDFHAEVGK